LFARAEIVITDHEPALSVPTGALVVFAGLEKVLAVREGKAVEQNADQGREDRFHRVRLADCRVTGGVSQS
jgi:hypothetical protein